MAVNDKTKNDTTNQTPTQIANQSFDQTFQLNIVEPAVYNPVTGNMDRMVQPGQTLPTSGLNASGTITPVTVGFDTTFTQTKLISGTTYTRTCTLNSNTGVFTYSNWS